MPKYYDGLGNDVTHYVKTLEEKEELAEAYRKEVLKLKADIKRLNKELKKKKKEIE
jgi:hypothetical protein